MVLGDLKLDKNKPPYLPSKGGLGEREREKACSERFSTTKSMAIVFFT
jgi:hypothetical protein